MKKETTADFQRKTLEAFRAQQEAYLGAVKKWRESMAKGGLTPPPWPQFTPPNFAPNPSEMAEASYAFAAKMLAEQSRFMEELSKAMTAPAKKG